MDKASELKLYKLLVTEDNENYTKLADELGWVSEDKFLVWISYLWISEFIESLKNIFGESLFDDGGFEGNFQRNDVCFDLSMIVEGYGIDLKAIFPKNKYSH